MDASTLPPGTVIDRYTVDQVIGVGGMAVVWRVHHNDLGSVHALKVLHTRSRSVRERLVQEGRVQAALRHPNLVAVTDMVVLEGGDPGLIMEYVQGPSLADLLEREPLTLEQADALAAGILAGVAEAHRSGLVHRDLKPANILLEPSAGTWVPKVADFGIAKILADDGSTTGGRTRSGVTMGTPRYMAPEQITDAAKVGPAADIFALGVILYELATYRRPFEADHDHGTSTKVLEGTYVLPRVLRPDLPEQMERAIVAALQPDPAERPPTVEALAELWFGGRPPLPTQARPFPSVERIVTVSHASGAWTPIQTTGLESRLPSPPRGRLPLALLGGVLALGGALMLAAGAAATWWAWPGVEVAPGTPEADPAMAASVAPPSDEGPEAPDEPDPTADEREAALRDGVPDPHAAPGDSGDATEAPSDGEAEPAVPSPEPPAVVKVAEIERLAARGGLEAWQELDRIVREEESPRARKAAWEAVLSTWNADPPGAVVLEKTLSWQLANGRRDDAVEAVEALGEKGDRPRLLLPGLKRNLAQVRIATLDAIVAFQARKAGRFDWRPHLEPLTKAGSEEVRKKAERLLRKL